MTIRTEGDRKKMSQLVKTLPALGPSNPVSRCRFRIFPDAIGLSSRVYT
ncbi:hypothetical protein IQ252_08030 [Tychonema sp. LEGE 07203]|nr:hypothetical protein [Tychonema sp. LEGE 07203]